MSRVLAACALTVLLAGCPREEVDAERTDDKSGCRKDTDCKGDRVCVKGECKKDDSEKAKPSASTAAAPAPPPVAPPPPPVVPAPPPPQQGGNLPPVAPPSLAFVEVPIETWQPRLGPKMVRGSEVVHPVYEGPFGPSAKALFAVTKRPDDTFYVYVMGDDNAPWPAGPLAEPGLDIAEKISAVAFFDADGDGTTDALVMPLYKTVRGACCYNKNVLLRWTDKGLRRLLKIEPKIEALDSVEKVKTALGR